MISVADVVNGVLPELQALEVLRQELKRKLGLFYKIVGGVALVALIIVVIFQNQVAMVGAVILSVITLAIAWFTIVGDVRSQYVTRYKEKVMSAVVAEFDSNLNYRLKPGPSRSDFQNTELYQYPDRYNSEDLIYGKYGETDLQFGEVHAEDRRRRKTKNGTQTYYVTIFKGILFSADFHKDFKGRTFVLSDNAENLLGGIGRAFQKLASKSGTRLVQMDDPEFEKQFAIYSSDEVECRYILSHSLMSRLTDLRKKFDGQDLRICFKNSSVHIAVPYRSQFLEPNINAPATDTGQIQSLIAQVGVFLQIVEELNLNTRIWSKE